METRENNSKPLLLHFLAVVPVDFFLSSQTNDEVFFFWATIKGK